MNANPEAISPENINAHLREWSAGETFVRPVSIERVEVRDNALDALRDEVQAYATNGRVLLVADHTPMTRAGEDLKAAIESALAPVCTLATRRLPDGASEPFHATLEGARQLQSELHSVAAIVSAGSGSVTDTAKYARHLALEADPNRRLPFICFPTAASVTAYTSALAVLSIDGVKRTLPARAPDAVICDLQTLADAPSIMTQAGFGDVMARSVAYGDWYLAHELGMDDGFSLIPARLLDRAEQEMLDRAEQVARGELDGIRAVTDALLLAGMAMSVVQQTAPVSGWEHVLSHYLDLTSGLDGRELSLHGAQVGVGTLVSARAYERFNTELDLDRVQQEMRAEGMRRVVDEAFAPLAARPGLLDEIWRDLNKKIDRWNAAEGARSRFVARKRAGELDAFLAANVRPAGEVQTALERAGCPLTFPGLTPPISTPRAQSAILHAHRIRARFTLGDLLDHTRWLTLASAADLLETRPS